MDDPGFNAILDKIYAVIHDDTHFQKGTLNMRTQKCFAVKPQINGNDELQVRYRCILSLTSYAESLANLPDLVDNCQSVHKPGD